jgi:hypothetical protein
VANKLIIDPKALKEICVALEALEDKRALAPELAAVEPMPERVRRFWEHQERIIQPWEIESRQEREERDEAESRGSWTG